MQGRTDAPLSELGRKQISELAELWLQEGRALTSILASPLARARESAEIFGQRLGLAISIDEIWMERDYGEAEGKQYQTIRTVSPPRSPFSPIFHSGESNWDLQLRASKAVSKLAALPPGNYLVVSHGGFLNAVLRLLGGSTAFAQSGLRFRLENAGDADLEFDPELGTWTMLAFGAAR